MKQLTFIEAPPDRVDLPKPTSPVVKELARREAAADRILALLQERPRLNTELIHEAMNLTGRISDLRKRGYHINATLVSKGVWRYELVKP